MTAERPSREDWARLFPSQGRRRAEFKQAELHRTHACGTCQAEAVAAERERIEAALRAQPTPPRLYALSAWDLDCVLAIVRGERHDRP